MINLLTRRTDDYEQFEDVTFRLGKLDEFFDFLSQHDTLQLDTETNMVDDGPNAHWERELILIQMGSIDKSEQWIIDHTMFDNSELRRQLVFVFGEGAITFIAHNTKFEYIVLKQEFGVGPESIEDTYLMSRILNTGLELEPGYHSLKGCVKRFLGIDLSKEAQTTFSKDVLTPTQLEYAALDVVVVYDLFVELLKLINGWKLNNVYKVEKEVMKVYADMELSPMRFDEKMWNKLSDSLKVDDARIEKELNAIVLEDQRLVAYLKSSKIIIGEHLIQPEDELTLNWGSPVHRKAALLKMIPDLASVAKFTKPELKKVLKNDEVSGISRRLLELYMNREYSVLNRYLRMFYKDWILSEGYFVPKDTILINWASNVHKLYIFQFYYPNLENTNAKTLSRIYTNKLINKYKEYSKVHKYLTTYGPSFIKKYVRDDMTIAPQGVNQILSTGRISFGILLQLPAQARFRNAFLPPEDDWVFVDSDYSSAEVCIFAYAAGETAFLDAIKSGKDLHMMSASLIFADKWKEVAEPGCTHLIDGSKCDCAAHNKLRKQSKAITFGLAYGLTYKGLAQRLDIGRTEAKELMEQFFKTFPHLQGFFQDNAEFGMKNNYIIGLPPTKRIRFYHPPANDGEKNAIGRQSQNYPIQEANASMMKIAMIMMRKKIREDNLPVKLHLPIHDKQNCRV